MTCISNSLAETDPAAMLSDMEIDSVSAVLELRQQPYVSPPPSTTTFQAGLLLTGSSGAIAQERPYAVVIDTNVFVSRLELLKDLLVDLPGNMMLVVPWIVLAELDHLKTRIGNGASNSARAAIQFLELAFMTFRDGRICGEKLVENHRRKTNDDLILDCALNLQSLGFAVSLVTDDRNLRLKSTVNEVMSLSVAEFTLDNVYSATVKYTTTATETGSAPTTKLNHLVAVPLRHLDAEEDCRELVRKVERVLQTAFHDALYIHLQDTFGENLDFVLKHKPPWSSLDILVMLKRDWGSMWRACFGSQQRDLIESTTELYKSLSRGGTVSKAAAWDLSNSILKLIDAWLNQITKPSTAVIAKLEATKVDLTNAMCGYEVEPMRVDHDSVIETTRAQNGNSSGSSFTKTKTETENFCVVTVTLCSQRVQKLIDALQHQSAQQVVNSSTWLLSLVAQLRSFGSYVALMAHQLVTADILGYQQSLQIACNTLVNLVVLLNVGDINSLRLRDSMDDLFADPLLVEGIPSMSEWYHQAANFIESKM